MVISTILIGLLPIFFGAYIAFLTKQNDTEKLSRFGEFKPMRVLLGVKLGSYLHFILFILIPIALGLGIIFAGYNGVSIIQLQEE